MSKELFKTSHGLVNVSVIGAIQYHADKGVVISNKDGVLVKYIPEEDYTKCKSLMEDIRNKMLAINNLDGFIPLPNNGLLHESLVSSTSLANDVNVVINDINQNIIVWVDCQSPAIASKVLDVVDSALASNSKGLSPIDWDGLLKEDVASEVKGDVKSAKPVLDLKNI